MGTKHGMDGQRMRIKQAFTSHGGRPGSVSLLIKDHKTMKEGDRIDPTRLVCVAKGGVGARLSNLNSIILNKVADAIGAETECISTEDALRSILETNRRIQERITCDKGYAEKMKHLSILSLDVKAMYPSLKLGSVKCILKELIVKVQEEGKMRFDNVEWKEVGKYLAITMTKEERVSEGLESAIPERNVGNSFRGRKPGPAYWESDTVERERTDGKKEKIDKWKIAEEPSEEQKIRMVANMLIKSVEISISNHMYRFNGTMYKQEDGGPIGAELSQAIARLVMVWWDKQFLKLCNEIGIEVDLYTRYVDDSNLAVIPHQPGTRFIEGSLQVMPQYVQQDMEKGTDKFTGELLREVANSVIPMLKFEEDVCSNHYDGRLPILDLKVWIEKSEKETKINHTFYRKPMATKFTLMENTAYPVSQLRAVFLEEILRRLRNCYPSMSKEEKGVHLTEFAMCMKKSGFSEKYRKSVFEQAVKRYEKELNNHLEGIQDIYRSRDERKRQIKEKGGKTGKEDWFRKPRKENNEKVPTSILKIPYTGGVLMKAIRETVDECTPPKGTKIRIQEDTGIKLCHLLVRPDPFPKSSCGRSECRTISKRRGQNEGCFETCFQGHVNYTITCDACEDERKSGRSDVVRVYVGETARGCYERYKGHESQYKAKTGFMFKHAVEHHGGEMGLSFSVNRECVDRDPLRRVLRESVRINEMMKRKKTELLNTREEYFGIKSIRTEFSQGW